ncbi:MAG: recombinase family protein [Clostridia bacterium]|nr:recombinase family protein [Clostridia bacterium]
MRGFGYIRVSTEEQAQDDRYSISTQTNKIKSHFKKNGIVLVDTFIDDVSGKGTAKRDEFQEMLKRLDEVDLVAVTEVDRYARNMLDSLNTVDQIIKRGKSFIAIEDNLEITATSSENDELNFHVKSMFAHYFSKQLARKVKNNMLEKASKGGYNTKAPLGYNLAEKKLVVNENEATIVKKIFDYYLQNMGIRAIAEELNRLGYRSKPTKNFPAGAPFQAFPVRKILKNRVYIGITSWGGIIKKDTHEPIISEELFNEVQKRIERKGEMGGRAQSSDFLLSGILKCGHCGQSMVGNKNKGRYSKTKDRAPIYRRYICNNYQKNGGCSFVWGHCADVEKTVLDYIESEVPREEASKYLNQTPMAFDPEKLKKERDSIRHALEEEMPTRYDRQIQLYEKGRIDDEKLDIAFSRLKKEEEDLKKKLQELESKLTLTPEALEEMRKARLATFYSVFDKDDIAQRKAWVQNNIKEIRYFDIDTIEVISYI